MSIFDGVRSEPVMLNVERIATIRRAPDAQREVAAMSADNIVVPGKGITLSDLYDADKRTSDRYTALVAATTPIPHPLTGVAYADGEIPDTTAGHINCTGCRIGRPCAMRRLHPAYTRDVPR